MPPHNPLDFPKGKQSKFFVRNLNIKKQLQKNQKKIITKIQNPNVIKSHNNFSKQNFKTDRFEKITMHQ